MLKFLLLLNFLATSTAASAKKKVVVVGAGISGLAAARTMIDHYPELEVTVFEARGRSGGRIWTADNSDAAWKGVPGAARDMGAGYIDGSTSHHPITKIQTALGLEIYDSSRADALQSDPSLNNTDKLFNCDNKGPCTEVENHKYDEFLHLLHIAQLQARGDLTVDRPLWDSLAGLSYGGLTRESALFQYHLVWNPEFEYGASVTKLSSWWYNADAGFPGKDFQIAKGFQAISTALLEGKVRLNSGEHRRVEVTVAASPVPIDVTYGARVDKVTWNDPHQAGVALTVAGQPDAVIADYVVLTLPLGVLKAGSVVFDPPLPPPTQQAIDKIGFGNVFKLAMKFDSVWWPTTPGTRYYGLARETKRGLFTYFLDMQEVAKTPVLMTFGLGEEAYVCEGMDDAALWSAARANLVKIFGSKVVPVGAPAMQRSGWSQDPFAKGAYSYKAVGSNPSDYLKFQTSPMLGRVFFAGEHTDPIYPASTQGALMSGQHAARAVAASAGTTTTAPRH